jgi:hypothetical protein
MPSLGVPEVPMRFAYGQPSGLGSMQILPAAVRAARYGFEQPPALQQIEALADAWAADGNLAGEVGRRSRPSRRRGPAREIQYRIFISRPTEKSKPARIAAFASAS